MQAASLARRLITLVGVFSALTVLIPTAARAATLTEVTGFGSNPGNLQMFEYIPNGLAANRPIVVLLHGCQGTAAAYDNESGWTKWADQLGFALVVPQQKTANNIARCFNWFNVADHTRGQGEALSIKQMVDWTIANRGSDATRVYVTGLSAGGAMTAVMLATYPDVFKAGAPVAGMPYKCATKSGGETNACGNGTMNLTPQEWGDKVRAASSWTGPWPKVSIWHGTADTVVAYQNLTEMLEQWTNVHGIDQVAETTDTVNGFPHAVHRTAGGTAVVETYSLTGMAHGQPVDPGTGAQQCGVATSVFLDVNICASWYIAGWFGLV